MLFLAYTHSPFRKKKTLVICSFSVILQSIVVVCELQNISILIYKQTCPPLSIIWNTSQVRPSGNNHSGTFMLKILQRQELLSYNSLPKSHEGSTRDLSLDFKISNCPWSDKILRMVSSGTETKSNQTVVVKTPEIFQRPPWLCCFHRAAGLLYSADSESVFSH